MRRGGSCWRGEVHDGVGRFMLEGERFMLEEGRCRLEGERFVFEEGRFMLQIGRGSFWRMVGFILEGERFMLEGGGS